jgi:hypothetical protein
MRRYVCNWCSNCGHYYRGKNRKVGCLKMSFCEHPTIKESNDGKHKWLATWRWSLLDKLKTSPRWCPLKTLDKH